jgi:hypothetical protein
MIFETKRKKKDLGEIKRRLNTMNSIETTPSKLFSCYAQCKGVSPFSFFALTSIHLSKIACIILTYPHEV